MRQHVNPLSRFFQNQLDIPDPEDLFLDKTLPIHLDIGSAKGNFLINFASLEKGWNFLGVDIRSKLVDSAEKVRKEKELTNLRFFFCNANVSLHRWLESLKVGQLQRVSIQFPDPWFKKRHQKRRVLSPSLLGSLSSNLTLGSELYLQSDVLPVITSMIKLINFSGCFDCIHSKESKWLNFNPYNLPTEREEYVTAKGLPVYRTLFLRNDNDVPDLSELSKSYEFINN
ncbi:MULTISPECIES: tRNA (guanosine(46)-N7)-methyltransferase TrmB [Prochlorococcus]|uniref:tRNA (guanosine(46)-N7)-methyltransferase TrmB n=1 Tax=Prochlorococcus TaxID=1218 RepID=UPI00056079C6|nr:MULTISPECIES: tRNA (guanosine(46)-N7)-methyltransferase TrmB [Prochlorococcus]